MGIIKVINRKDGFSVLMAVIVGVLVANLLSVFFGNLSHQIIQDVSSTDTQSFGSYQRLSTDVQIYLRSLLTFAFAVLLIEAVTVTVLTYARTKSKK